jgi:hypothetical protein
MSNNTVNATLRRIGYTGEQMTAHGFRATARTLLAELGWKPDAIERQLAHKASGPLGAAYDRAQFLSERRQMMQAWADYLEGLRADARKIVPIGANRESLKKVPATQRRGWSLYQAPALRLLTVNGVAYCRAGCAA